MTESVSLFQLISKVKNVLSGHFNDAVWIRAEIGDLNYHAKGQLSYKNVKRHS